MITNAELGIPEYKVRKQRKAKPYSKPESIKEFEWEYDIWYYMDRKIPEGLQIKHKFDDKTANSLTKLIIEYLRMNGCFGARINTQGNYNAKIGKFVRSGSTNGMADINAVVKGKSISIEVKIGKDKIRESQLKVKREIEAAGGVYLIVRSFDDFLEQFEKYLYE